MNRLNYQNADMGEVISAEDEETQINNNIGPRIHLWETWEATWDCVVPRRMENQEGILLQRVGKFMAFYAHMSLPIWYSETQLG